MKGSFEILFVISCFLPLFMGGVTYLYYKESKDPQIPHLTEFWASLAVNISLLMILIHDEASAVGGAMLGWLWPLRTFKLVLEDISGVSFMGRWHYITLGAGAFLTFSLAGYGLPFHVYALPFSLITGGVGLHVTFESWRKSQSSQMSILQGMSYILFGLFFMTKLFYPFWASVFKFIEFGVIAEIFCLIGFAGVMLSTYTEHFWQRHDAVLERILKERSDKFVGQSKFTELGMMSAGIAHEINNPLAVIQARTTQLLRIFKNPDKQRELAEGLQQILYTSERINKTIQGVREFVHQDEKEVWTEVTLKEVFDDVLAFTGQRMKNHGVNLRFYGLENCSVICHKIQLEQVVMNLLNNSFDAIEYLPDKWIEVSCYNKDGRVQIFFKDSGHGIPKDISARIMEPFFSTKDIGKGTGLGLALARGIVEKHGGTLNYLEDCPHTTFLLELPKNKHRDWNMPLH